MEAAWHGDDDDIGGESYNNSSLLKYNSIYIDERSELLRGREREGGKRKRERDKYVDRAGDRERLRDKEIETLS